MERAIGDVFDFNGIKLIVKRVNNRFCDGCYFKQFNHECWQINGIEDTGLCSGRFRSDKNDVIFVKVKDDKKRRNKS